MGYLRSDRIETPRRRVVILYTFPDRQLCTARDMQYGTIQVDLSTTIGPVVVWPVPGEQWYVTKISEKWVLDRRTAHQHTALVESQTVGDAVWHNLDGDLIVVDRYGRLGGAGNLRLGAPVTRTASAAGQMIPVSRNGSVIGYIQLYS